MTRQEQYKNTPLFNEFSKYLRNNPWLNSMHGHTFVKLDWVCFNYEKNLFMIVESKTYAGKKKIGDMSVPYAQSKSMRLLSDILSHSPMFKGIHLLEFENTSPVDGKIWLDKKPITESTLIAFMGFELSDEWYQSIYSQSISGVNEVSLKYFTKPYDFDIKRSGLLYDESGLENDLIMTKIRIET